MTKKNIILYAAIAILFASIGLYFGFNRWSTVSPTPMSASQLFTLSLPDAKGEQHDLALWKGKILIVNFWATWCGPCVQEMPELSALQTEVSLKNVQVVGIGIDSAANIADFSSKYRISYPLYVAGMDGSELARQFGDLTGSLPFTVLIGPDGEVRKTYLGRLKFDELRRDIATL